MKYFLHKLKVNVNWMELSIIVGLLIGFGAVGSMLRDNFTLLYLFILASIGISLIEFTRATLAKTNKSLFSGKVVCYCGSLRFIETFKRVEYESVLNGEIALLPCCMFIDIQRVHGENSTYKIMADQLHKRKIDICDIVFVLNVGGYIGNSTRSEIDYALSINKLFIFSKHESKIFYPHL